MKALMSRQVGVERAGEQLISAQTQLAFWSDVTEQLAPPVPQAWELRNMLLIAGAMAYSAASREESRGAHCRSDFPETQTDAAHTECTLDGQSFEITRTLATRVST
jgi:L-aspartate oxidase